MATKLVLAAFFKQNIFFFQIFFQKCKCIQVLLLGVKFYLEIPFGNWFFKFLSRNYFCETKKLFFGLHLEMEHFWTFFLLIYGCLRWIQICCKFRTEISTEKYLKMVGSKWTPQKNESEKKKLKILIYNG